MHFSGVHLRKVTTRTVVAWNTKYIVTSRALESRRLDAYNEPLLVADPTWAEPKTLSTQVVTAAPAFQVSRYLTRFIAVAKVDPFCGCFVRLSRVVVPRCCKPHCLYEIGYIPKAR